MESKKLSGIIIGSAVAAIIIIIIAFFFIKYLRRNHLIRIISDGLPQHNQLNVHGSEADGDGELDLTADDQHKSSNQNRVTFRDFESLYEYFVDDDEDGNCTNSCNTQDSKFTISDECVGSDIICKIIEKFFSNNSNNLDVKNIYIDKIKIESEKFASEKDKIQYLINALGKNICARVGRECKAVLFNFYHAEFGEKIAAFPFADKFSPIINKHDSGKGNTSYRDVYKGKANLFKNDFRLDKKKSDIVRLFLLAIITETKYGNSIYDAMNLIPLRACCGDQFDYCRMNAYEGTNSVYGKYFVKESEESKKYYNAALEVFTKFRYLLDPFKNHELVREDFQLIDEIINKHENCIFKDAKMKCKALLNNLKHDLEVLKSESFHKYILDCNNQSKKEVRSLINKLDDFSISNVDCGKLSFAAHDLLQHSFVFTYGEQFQKDKSKYENVFNIDIVMKNIIDISKIDFSTHIADDDSNINTKESTFQQGNQFNTLGRLYRYTSFVENIIEQLENIVQFHEISDDEKEKIIPAMCNIIRNMDLIHDQVYFEAIGAVLQNFFDIDAEDQKILFSQIIDNLDFEYALNIVNTSNISDLYQCALRSSLQSKEEKFINHVDNQLRKISNELEKIDWLPKLCKDFNSKYDDAYYMTTYEVITGRNPKTQFFGMVALNCDDFLKFKDGDELYMMDNTTSAFVKVSDIAQLRDSQMKY